MKKCIRYWLALFLLPALGACQDVETITDAASGETGKTTVVRASIGEEPDTRAQVQYGTQDAAAGELFMWNSNDSFSVYDLSEPDLAPPVFFGISNFDPTKPMKVAEFSSSEFTISAGTNIIAIYENGSYVGILSPITDVQTGKTGFKPTLGYSPNLLQLQSETPGHDDLTYMQQGICMYATGSVRDDGTLSPLTFKHLSALFRFTLRNNQSDPLSDPNITIVFPEKILCSQKPIAIWEDGTVESQAEESKKLSEATLNSLATIASGSSYDLFLPVLPVAETGNTASALTIKVTFANGVEKSVEIADFNNVDIKAGLRYWIDLTVKADGTLVQTFKPDYAWFSEGQTEYSISTPGELHALANIVKGDAEAMAATGTTGPVHFSGKTIRLAGDIDLGNKVWTPIGTSATASFRGTFDGNGHSVTNLRINSTAAAGLFGFVMNGKVCNLRVSGNLKSTGNFTGGVVGNLTHTSTVENCIFNGELEGNEYVGGIAGNTNESTVTGCHTKGRITGKRNVGGVIGSNRSTLEHCYSEAAISASEGLAGGICGGNRTGGTIINCYATGTLSAPAQAGGILGMGEADSDLTTCIALNAGITRESGTEQSFGRIIGYDLSNYASSAACPAFAGMSIKDAAGGTFVPTGIAGIDLAASGCLTETTYTSLGFTTENGWMNDATWQYLPWNKAFESFHGLTEADYRIAMPQHITDALGN